MPLFLSFLCNLSEMKSQFFFLELESLSSNHWFRPLVNFFAEWDAVVDLTGERVREESQGYTNATNQNSAFAAFTGNRL